MVERFERRSAAPTIPPACFEIGSRPSGRGLGLSSGGRSTRSPARGPALLVVHASFRRRAEETSRARVANRIHLDTVLPAEAASRPIGVSPLACAAAAAMIRGYFTSRKMRSLCTSAPMRGEIQPSPSIAPANTRSLEGNSVGSCLHRRPRRSSAERAPLSQSETVRRGMPSRLQMSVAFAPTSASSIAARTCSPNAPSTPMRLRGLEPPSP